MRLGPNRFTSSAHLRQQGRLPTGGLMQAPPTHKRKRGGEYGGNGAPGSSSDDSEAAEERAEHHYMLRVDDEFDKGRYTVTMQLGKGTFGRVVEMWDTVDKAAIAVKVVRAVEKCVAQHSLSAALARTL